jgi:hypothetical protein
MLDYIVYRSEAVFPVGDACDTDILRTARGRNPAEGLTGFLHREAERYFQFIEGPPDRLAAAVTRIGRDRRHHSMMTLRRGRSDRRRFGGWSMGRVEAGAPSLGTRVGTAGLLAVEADEVLAYLSAAAQRQAASRGA